MSAEETSQPPGPGPAGEPMPPSEDEIRAAYEAELARLTSTDVMLQAAVNLLNIAGRRLGAPPPGAEPEGADAGAGAQASDRDLAQVRDSIDAVRALLEILDRTMASELGPLRDALSQLQFAFARAVSESGTPGSGPEAARTGEPGSEAEGGAERAPGAGERAEQEARRRQGPAEASGRLWVPGR